jgi:hypothetical protein
MVQRFILVLLSLCFTLAARAQDTDAPGPRPPAYQIDGAPNGEYATQLRASIETLSLEDRDAFFKALRRQQKELKLRIQDTEKLTKDAKNLKEAMEQKRTSLRNKAQALLDDQVSVLIAYKGIAQTIERERAKHDPQRIDADELKVDLYGGFQFSSLFRDPGQNASFFSKSRPFASLDIRQSFRRPGGKSWFETFSTLSFQSSSLEQSEALNIITTSGRFRGEAGLWWMRSMSEGVSWGIVGSVGVVGYSQPDDQAGLSSTNRDEFRNRSRLGFTLRQETGALKGSFAEWSYVRDPLFITRDRLFVRGRVVLTQFGSEGASGDFYMEGSVSKGRQGRDEAVLLVGLRLSTLSFFRSLGGN